METITIKTQDSEHQYDKYRNPITTWDPKYCEWVINEEYENCNIDWIMDSKGSTMFPVGVTRKSLEGKNYPDIFVAWYFTPEEYEKFFNTKYDPSKSDLVLTKYWGYLEYSKEQAIKYLGHYCDFNKGAYKTIIRYNNEIIYKDKLI